MTLSDPNFISAQKQISDAEFLLKDTYNLTKDQKILLSVLLKIFDSIKLAMNFYLKDKITSRDSFSSKLNLLSNSLNEKSKLTQDDIEFIEFIRKFVEYHEKSEVEFARKEKFIIADDNYSLHTLNNENLSDYLVRAKKIVAELLMKVR